MNAICFTDTAAGRLVWTWDVQSRAWTLWASYPLAAKGA